MIDSDILEDKMYNSMTEFGKALNGLTNYIEGDASDVIRKIVIDVFTGITLRSPVDTGYYRACHSITTGDSEPDSSENNVPIEKINRKSRNIGKKNIDKNYGVTKTNADAHAANREMVDKFRAWNLKDGPIWIFNNVVYAEVIERGNSHQAPNGVYTEALNELTTKLNDALDIG